MENTKKFIINGKELTVILPDFNDIKKSVSGYRDSYYKQDFNEDLGHNSCLYKIYTDEHSTFDEVEKDVEEMLGLVSKLEDDDDLLKEHVELVRKKKNGMFWLNSGHCIKELESCTVYFTDFTNAWATPELRLDVISENECTLRLRDRTRTY